MLLETHAHIAVCLQCSHTEATQTLLARELYKSSLMKLCDIHVIVQISDSLCTTSSKTASGHVTARDAILHEHVVWGV